MKRNQSSNNVDLMQVRYEAKDREHMESTAKSAWNKFTRFLDKFVEIIFISVLIANGIWNLVSMFVGNDPDDKGFSILRLLLLLNYFFLAVLIFASWRGNLTVLVYFGFLRVPTSKALFLLFCACMTFPSEVSSKQTNEVMFVLAIILIIAAVLQILKLCNKNESASRIGENPNNLKEPMASGQYQR